MTSILINDTIVHQCIGRVEREEGLGWGVSEAAPTHSPHIIASQLGFSIFIGRAKRAPL